jgi:hypothetical protein
MTDVMYCSGHSHDAVTHVAALYGSFWQRILVETRRP